MILTAVPEPVVRAANSEVRKVISVKAYAVLAAVVAAAGIAAFAVLAFTAEPIEWAGVVPESLGVGGIAVAAALGLAVVLAGIFGAEATGAEYRYGTLAAGSLFTPDRNVLLGAKLAVTAAFSLATVLVVEVVGFGLVLLVARGKITVGGQHLAVLAGVALAVVCWSVIGAALGFLLRNPGRAVTVVVGLLIAEPLLWLIANALGIPAVCTVLPVSATVGSITGGVIPENVAFIAPTPAAIVLLLLWATAAGTAAWWDFTRREPADTSALRFGGRN
ncbi:ABC transporter permease [Nocardia sp. 2]|uniref:ABC transporter permease n=1 Tax=Nocardia acididurans TaxID=2802282 RepID=A0ABS1M7A3_9NOCA|nr:ABC transporter permease [Nocardia acididurans]MBL1076176.1 ABC transporter permease [Nocardia acididurans]